MNDFLTLAERTETLRACSPQFEPLGGGAFRLLHAKGAMLGDWLTQALEPMRRAARRRQTLRELGRLDDRALADIGISRADIGRIADITARQAPDEAMTAADLHRRHP